VAVLPALHALTGPLLSAILAAGIVLLSALLKGAIGFGFPTLGTPLLSLVMDVKAAVVVLILPNIVMDSVQFIRLGAPMAIVRRFSVLLLFGAVGTVVGTRLLVGLSSRTATLVLGIFIVSFVILNATGVPLRVSRRWEPWSSPLAGLVAGVVGGITNVPGTPLVIYFHALGLGKHEFVASVAFTFVAYKMVQLGAVFYYGLLTPSRMGASLLLALVALLGFGLGLVVQDRLEQRTFSRVILVVLGLLGLWLLVRALVLS
jgi:uncharacterized protein